MMGYFALTYTLHIHQSLNEIEKLQKFLQKEGWSLCWLWSRQPGLMLPTWHPWSVATWGLRPGMQKVISGMHNCCIVTEFKPQVPILLFQDTKLHF